MTQSNQDRFLLCPFCDGPPLTVQEYLEHTSNCKTSNDGSDNDVNTNSDSSRTSSPAEITASSPAPTPDDQSQLVVAPFICPLCDQKFSIQAYVDHTPACSAATESTRRGVSERPIVNGNEREGNQAGGRKRTVGDKNIDPMQQPFGQRHGSAPTVQESVPQRPLKANISRSHPGSSSLCSNSPNVNVQAAIPSSEYRQEPAVVALSDRPQDAFMGPRDHVTSEPAASHVERSKEKQNHEIEAAAATPAQNMDPQDVVNSFVTALFQKIEPRLRQMENQIVHSRRRVEVVEMSLMMKLDAIERALVDSNNREDGPEI